MSAAIDLLKDSAFRKFAGKPLSSLGYANFIKSLMKARKLKGQGPKDLPRYLLPELFKGLGQRKAVVTSTGAVTFEAFAERIVRLSNSFYQHGLSENDRVAILVNNEQAWFDVMGACTISGIRMPMLNTHLKEDELLKCVNNCAPKVLVFSYSFLEKIKTIEKDLVGVKHLVCSCSDTEASSLPENYLSLKEFIAKGELQLVDGGFGLAQMAFSGGSTGVPKFIVESNTKPDANPRMKGMTKQDIDKIKVKFISGLVGLGMGRVKGQIVSLIPGPLYHAGVQTAVFPLYIGGTIVAMNKFDAEYFLRLIEQEKVNYTFVAPTMLERVLKLPKEIQEKYDLSTMQIILCAAAPCADYVKKGINELFKKQGAQHNVFNEYYGSSEAAVVTVLKPEDYEQNPERYKSVGKAIGSDCMIYNVDEGRACEAGEDGHVLVRNSRMYTVNYGNSTEMDESFIELEGVYWFDDGCIGHMDEDGFLYLTSRSKDMIISGGVNIFPVEIEEAIRSHQNIMDVAVVKVPDADLGEVPGALIQTVNGDVIPDDEVLEHCKVNGLYGFKLPKHIKFIEQLPKNTSGKIRKKDLEGQFDKA